MPIGSIIVIIVVLLLAFSAPVGGLKGLVEWFKNEIRELKKGLKGETDNK